MAEAHPVGFQWVMEAKARGATVIHVDPRFSRTSAMADMYVPIRAGADIAFLGGIIKYVLENEKYFREYVLAYTNASTILTDDFMDTEDLDGVFSGLDRENRTYDFEAWRYQGQRRRGGGRQPGPARQQRRAARAASARPDAARRTAPAARRPHPSADTDETLQHPRCVFQVLKRHFARYTPEMVEQISGISPEDFRKICETLTENSGRERTTAFVYSVGWTQHTVGVQYIRTGAILQTLLGNMGRPGGGILALRGHASIQGSTDIPTLFDLLPGYLPMPHVHGNEDLDTYVAAESMDNGFWANMRSYMVSLLKAWWGDAATAENDFCYDYLPRLTGSHSTYETVMAQIAGDCKGYFLFGENPAVGSANARMQRLGMANQDWLVVRDFSLIESATWWKDGPEIETGEMRTEDIKTEVFFLPAAAHTEKAGSFTNTQRMLQWHHQAVEPAGAARSDLWFAYHLGRRIREKLAGSADEMDRPVLDLTWDYPLKGAQQDPDADAVLAEVNGWDGDGKPVASYTQLKDDGSTASGCWIYCGVHADGVNQAARRKPGREQNWVANEWGWAWPANRRILYNRASADPEGKPWSERKALVWWDGDSGKWAGHDIADFVADRPPSYRPRRRRPRGGRDLRDRRVHHAGRREGVAVRAGRAGRRPAADALRAAGLAGAEPAVPPAGAQPGPPGHPAPGYPLPAQRQRAGLGRVPLRRDHLPADRAPHGGRDEPVAALPGRAPAGVLLRGLARARRRAGPGAHGMGDDHQRPQRHRGPGHGDEKDELPNDSGPAPAPDRAALPLGAQRDLDRGRG